MENTTLSVNETARRLSTRVDSVYKLLYSGLLDGRRVDGKWEISAVSVENYALNHSRHRRFVNQDTALATASA